MFLMVVFLTDEAVYSLLGNKKAVTVPCAFNEMIELNDINFDECIINRAGGLYEMIAENIHNILLKTNTTDAQNFTLRTARFAVFMGLLIDFLVAWDFDEHMRSVVQSAFEKHYYESYFTSDSVLPIREEFNKLWTYANTLCFSNK